MPPPTLTGDTTTRSAPRYSIANTVPTMSMIESTAPTSCRCTLSIVDPWMDASTSASRWNILVARALPASLSADFSMAA